MMVVVEGGGGFCYGKISLSLFDTVTASSHRSRERSPIEPSPRRLLSDVTLLLCVDVQGHQNKSCEGAGPCHRHELICDVLVFLVECGRLEAPEGEPGDDDDRAGPGHHH